MLVLAVLDTFFVSFKPPRENVHHTKQQLEHLHWSQSGGGEGGTDRGENIPKNSSNASRSLAVTNVN